MSSSINWDFFRGDGIACICNGIEIDNKIFGENIKTILKVICHSEGIKNVAIILERSDKLLSVVCASLIGGYTYIPIDPMLPANRIEYMLMNSETDLIITSSKYIDSYDGKYKTLNIDKVFDCKKNLFGDVFYPKINHNEVAYVIYTSGSTGTPKGVEITRDALFNLIEGVSRCIDFTHGKRILSSATMSFDMFVVESIVALHKGVTVVLANDKEYRNPKLLVNLIEKNDVNIVQMTPSKLQMILNCDKELKSFRSVTEVMLGGEAFRPEQYRILREKTHARIYNLYGPTEATVWVTINELIRGEDVDLGRPISNIQLHIIDNDGVVINDETVGEIAISGIGLAKGYINDEQLTAEKFTYISLGKTRERVYRTGDLGKFVNGRLYFMGRMDNQVKIRGYRIELEEIERVLEQNTAINSVSVVDIPIKNAESILCAFIVENEEIDDKEITRYLESYLPQYMIPSKYIRLDKLEYTFSEKVDRKLIATSFLKSDNKLAEEYKTACLQDDILSVIKQNTDLEILESISIESEWAAIGIDSITFISLIVALEEKFHISFEDDMILLSNFPTVQTMVEYVEKQICMQTRL